MSVIRMAGNCVMWSDVMEVSNNKQGDDVSSGGMGMGIKGVYSSAVA